MSAPARKVQLAIVGAGTAVAEIGLAMDAGLTSEATSRTALEQHMPALPTPLELAALARGLARAPRWPGHEGPL